MCLLWRANGDGSVGKNRPVTSPRTSNVMPARLIGVAMMTASNVPSSSVPPELCREYPSFAFPETTLTAVLRFTSVADALKSSWGRIERWWAACSSKECGTAANVRKVDGSLRLWLEVGSFGIRKYLAGISGYGPDEIFTRGKRKLQKFIIFCCRYVSLNGRADKLHFCLPVV